MSVGNFFYLKHLLFSGTSVCGFLVLSFIGLFQSIQEPNLKKIYIKYKYEDV